jgi:hypothetical protein
MAPGPIEIGPASGPNVALEIKKDISPPAKSPGAPNHEEHQYLDLIRDILTNGEHRPDRYGSLTLQLSIRANFSIELEQALSRSLRRLNYAFPSRAPLPTPPNYQHPYFPSSPQNASSRAPSLPSSSGLSPAPHPPSLCRNKASRSGTATAVANT